jgi:hypothetical protein
LLRAPLMVKPWSKNKRPRILDHQYHGAGSSDDYRAFH